MNQLIENILNEALTKSLKIILNNFVETVSDKYDIENSELEEMMEDEIKKFETREKGKKPGKKQIKKDVKKPVKTEKCIWELLRGDRKGEHCGKPFASDSTEYCTSHKKLKEKTASESKGKKVKSPKPISKKTESKDDKQIKITSHSVLKKYWNEKTGFYFEKIEGKFVVCGKIISSVIKPLNTEDYELCEKYNLSYSKEESEAEEEVKEIEEAEEEESEAEEEVKEAEEEEIEEEEEE